MTTVDSHALTLILTAFALALGVEKMTELSDYSRNMLTVSSHAVTFSWRALTMSSYTLTAML